MPERRRTKGGRSRTVAAKNGTYRDYTLIFLVLFLLAFGLVMLYSTSSYEAALQFGDSAHYLKRQLFATVLGLFVMFLVAALPYRMWGKLAGPVAIVAAVLVGLIIPFGVEANGAKRWLYFFGLSFQPAEAAKLATIIVTATMIEKLGSAVKTMKGILVTASPAIIYSAMLYLITRNLSSALIVMAIVACMLFVAVPDYKRFFLLGGAAVAAGGLWIYLTLRSARTAEESLNFRGGRILAWLNPQAYADDTAFQTLQALYAIGSGGLFGKGLGQSMQKLGYIPEAQNDMIFSIICEELGLFGAICIILLFILMIYRFMMIANNAPDLFGGMLVVGVLGHIAVQVVLNIAVVTNTIPNTGVSLPFISYGGTSVLFLLFEMGLVLSVARSIRLSPGEAAG